MIPYYRAVRRVSRQIAQAVQHTVEALRDTRVEHEPAFTDRMLGGIEESLRGFETHGIIWRAKTLTDRSGQSQEKKYGADFMGVLDLQLPDYKLTKGFLAQAKLVRPFQPINLADLKEQCEKMLALSPDSFVFLYSHNGVRVVPAISVVSANLQPTELYHHSVTRFFEDHLCSYIGDRAISAANEKALEELRQRYEARRLLMLEGKHRLIAHEGEK